MELARNFDEEQVGLNFAAVVDLLCVSEAPPQHVVRPVTTDRLDLLAIDEVMRVVRARWHEGASAWLLTPEQVKPANVALTEQGFCVATDVLTLRAMR